jgi:S-adenosylmethionine-diacylglycerol 3-amino-3-carboxypropyl transferase
MPFSRSPEAPSAGVAPPAGRGIEERAAFHFIRYASVWEDADILCEALSAVAEGGRLLSIASAGDNALALLMLDPAEVVAVDLSEAQLAALALRIVAFRAMEPAGLYAFLGVTPDDDRLGTYAAIRPALPPYARAFWDAHPDAVASGVIHAGRFERYLRLFRRRVLPLVHSRRRIDALLVQDTLEEQERFYREEWDTWRWRLIFRLFFGRFVMGRLGRDPAFFEQVEGPVGDRLLRRTRHALTAVPVRSNPYLTYIMTGNYSRDALPAYLRPENVPVIRERLQRVRLVRGSAESVAGPFDGFNLSDIFEYMEPATHERVYAALVGRAAPGARLAYWNMLAPRGPAPAVAERVRPLHRLASDLHARDNAWFYQAFHVDEVIP